MWAEGGGPSTLGEGSERWVAGRYKESGPLEVSPVQTRPLSSPVLSGPGNGGPVQQQSGREAERPIWTPGGVGLRRAVVPGSLHPPTRPPHPAGRRTRGALRPPVGAGMGTAERGAPPLASRAGSASPNRARCRRASPTARPPSPPRSRRPGRQRMGAQRGGVDGARARRGGPL